MLRTSGFAAAVSVICLGLMLGARSALAAVPEGSQSQVRRLLTLLAAVGDEYREGVKDGAVVQPIEYQEAQAFLGDAQDQLRALAPHLAKQGGDLQASLAAVAAAVTHKAPPDRIAAQLAALRQRLEAATGVSDQEFPPEAPSAARGKQLFASHCAACHGALGNGKGLLAAGLNPPPANFTDKAFIRGETPYDFFHVITLGKRKTAMPAWGQVLSVQQRWDLVSYLWTLAPGEPGEAEGQGVYLAHCASCHGVTGNGRAAFSAVLMKAAPDLSRPQALARRTDSELFATTTQGVRGSPMPAFARTLSAEDRWKAVAFMRLLSLGGPAAATAGPAGVEAEKGAVLGGLLHVLGTSYAAAWTGGQLKNSSEYVEATAVAQQASSAAAHLAETLNSTTPSAAAQLRKDMAALVTQVQAKAAPGQVQSSIQSLSAFLDQHAPAPAPADNSTGGEASAETSPGAALAQSAKMLDAAVAAYGRGDPRAATTAGEAYLQFEPLESAVGATNPALKTRIEESFLQLRQRMRKPGHNADVAALARAIHDDFARAAAAAQPRANRDALFFESATIILREGLEIVLVIGALIAYVMKTGHRRMQRSIYAGTVLGVVASLITAFAMGELFHLHPGSSDVLEGFTMLLAAVVLFWVSYWLISKAEADRWQRYIRGKVQTALTGGSAAALAGAAFLAVYREGFETVLFYQALYASAPGGEATVIAGFIAGAVALGCIYALFRRFQVRIPLQQFFFVTGLFLYAMAVIFAGQGVHELQEAGLVGMTPVAGVPTVPLLGIFPSVQSLLLQGLFVVLLLYATAITIRRLRAVKREVVGHEVPSADAGAGPLVEALRDAVDALRLDMRTMQRSTPGTLPAAVGERVEGLLVRVETLTDELQIRASGNGGGNGGGGRNSY